MKSAHSRGYRIFWTARHGRLDLLLNEQTWSPVFGAQEDDLVIALQGAASGGQTDIFVELECWFSDSFAATKTIDYQNLIERTIKNNREELFLHLIDSCPRSSRQCCSLMHLMVNENKTGLLKYFGRLCGHHQTRQQLKNRILNSRRSHNFKQHCLEMLFAKELERPPVEWQAAMEMQRLRDCARECADFIFRMGEEEEE